MSEDTKEKEVAATAPAATPAPKKKSNATKVLLISEVANERFAGFVRLLNQHLIKKSVALAVDAKKDEDELKAIKNKFNRNASPVVKAILESSTENVHEPYKTSIKIAFSDMTEDRLTEETEDFFLKLVEDFKPKAKPKAFLPSQEDLGLF